jgi:uncharacterized protein involved in tolerance to divalent cations
MNKLYYEVKCSAENINQAHTIIDSLLAKKLATGGQIVQSPARFLWKGDVVNQDYVTIHMYTNGENKGSMMDDIRETTVEDFPMITCTLPDDLNVELKTWIDQTLE